MRLATFVDEVLEQCEMCRSSDESPHGPAVGTSTVSMIGEKLRVDLPFSADIVACACDGCFLRVLPYDSRASE